MKTLDLVLKRKWYDMIASGEKTEVYREIKPYWANRLLYPIPLSVKNYWQSVVAKAFALVEENPRCFDLHNLLVGNYGTRGYDKVVFHLGYAKNRPTMTFAIKEIVCDEGKEEWGALPGETYFIIKLGERL